MYVDDLYFDYFSYDLGVECASINLRGTGNSLHLIYLRTRA